MGLRIKYDSMDGQYIYHKKYGEVQLNKDEMVYHTFMPTKIQDVAFVQTVWENFEGFNRK